MDIKDNGVLPDQIEGYRLHPAKRTLDIFTQKHPLSAQSDLGPSKQRGAALVLTAFVLLALVAALGLTIEVGRLYAAQAELDNVAQIAAIQSARALGACAVSEPASPQAAAEQAAGFAVTNNFRSNSGIGAPIVQLGVQSTENGLSRFQTSNQFVADSALVTINRPAPTLLFKFFSPSNQMTSIAGAVSRPQAGISVGSKLVDIGGLDGRNGVLSALLGGSVDIGLAGYQGLADAVVRVGDLIDLQAGALTPEEFLNTSLSLPDALSLLATAVDGTTGGTSDLAAGILSTLAGIADPSRNVLFGDILNIESGVESLVGGLPLNASDLLNSVAQAANTGSPVNLPLGVNLGGLARVNGTINVIEPPQVAFGRAGLDGNNQPRTVANTAQVAIQLNVEVLGALSGLGGALINLPVFIKVASAQATLDDIICAGLSKPANFAPQFQHTVEVGTGTSLASLGIGRFQDINAFNPVPAANNNVVLVNAVGIAQVATTRNIATNLGSGAGSQSVFFDGPFPPQDEAEIQTQRVGTDTGVALNNGLGNLIDELSRPGTLEVRLLGTCIPILCQITSGLLAPVLGVVIDLLNPVIDLLGDALLTPIFNLLGLDLGTADVSVQSVVANQPRLFCSNQSCLQTTTP